MEVTRIRYYDKETKEESPYLCKCSIVLDDLVIVHEIRIFKGTTKCHVVMPLKPSRTRTSNENSSNKRDNLFYPVKREFYEYLSDIILEGYSIYEKTGNDLYFPKGSMEVNVKNGEEERTNLL